MHVRLDNQILPFTEYIKILDLNTQHKTHHVICFVMVWFQRAKQCTVIRTGKKYFIFCCKKRFSWYKIHSFPFPSHFLAGDTDLDCRLSHCTYMPVAEHTGWAASATVMIPVIKGNGSGCDCFFGLPLCCIIFIKVTLTVSTTHINYFILPLTSAKFSVHFNRGDLVGEGVLHRATERGSNTRRSCFTDITH